MKHIVSSEWIVYIYIYIYISSYKLIFCLELGISCFLPVSSLLVNQTNDSRWNWFDWAEGTICTFSYLRNSFSQL